MKSQHTGSFHILSAENHGKGLASLLPFNKQKKNTYYSSTYLVKIRST